MKSSTPTALITGASSGIGLELARLMAADGYNLVIIARDQEKLDLIGDELSEKYQIEIKTIAADLAELRAISTIWQHLKKSQITIDTLINNAGFGDFGEFADSDWPRIQQMMELNMVALTHLSRLAAPGMIERKQGRILNVASLASFLPGPLMAVYYATKAYVLSFSVALANELEPHGVIVSTLCPGATATNFSQAANLSDSKLFKNSELMSASEVAKVGYEGLKQGKLVIIPGARNSFLAAASRMAPLKLAAKIGRSVQERDN